MFNLPSPTPSSGTVSQAQELELALISNPRKAINYKKFLKYNRGGNVDFQPVRLDIETISRCNFACQMCAVSEWQNGQRAEDMTLLKLKDALSGQHGIVEVKLTGLGEPMLQGDEYFGFIDYFREQHIWVRMVTNGSLLHINDNALKLAESGVNDITMSLDGSSAEVFEKIRRKSNFKQTSQNMLKLNKCLAERGQRITKAWCCVQKDNLEDLEMILIKAAELGFPELTFSLSLHGWGKSSLLEKNIELTKANKDLVTEDRCHQLIEIGNNHNIRTTFWNVSQKYGYSKGEELCPWPFERLYLSSDFRIVPCCMIGNPDTFEIPKGRFPENSNLDSVWFGNNYNDFRRAHRIGELPLVCKNCYSCAGNKI